MLDSAATKLYKPPPPCCSGSHLLSQTSFWNKVWHEARSRCPYLPYSQFPTESLLPAKPYKRTKGINKHYNCTAVQRTYVVIGVHEHERGRDYRFFTATDTRKGQTLSSRLHSSNFFSSSASFTTPRLAITVRAVTGKWWGSNLTSLYIQIDLYTNSRYDHTHTAHGYPSTQTHVAILPALYQPLITCVHATRALVHVTHDVITKVVTCITTLSHSVFNIPACNKRTGFILIVT